MEQKVNFEEVMERVGDIVEKEIGTRPYDKDIAKALGIAPAQYSNNKKRKNIPFEKISEYCAKKRVSINWVLYEQSSQMLNSNTEEIFKIKLLNDINGSAGGGSFNEETENFSYLSLDRVYSDMLGISEGDSVEAIRIVGDSMETTLKDNSIVIIDRNRTNIQNGGIFVLNTENGVLVKRVAINPSGGIDLISDNKNYPSQPVAQEGVTVIGKVIGALEKI